MAQSSSKCYCSVPCCSNNKQHFPYMSFHSFPADAKVRARWVKAIKRDEGPSFKILQGSTFVCSQHFAPEDIYSSASGRKQIKKGAVPSRFHWNGLGSQTRQSVHERARKRLGVAAVLPESAPEEMPAPGDSTEQALPADAVAKDHDYDCLPSPAELIENMDKKATWDRFYTENSSRTPNFKNFEWFFGFDSVRDFIMPFLHAKSHPGALLQVLDMGCGTSALGPCIYRHSPFPVRVTCADISPVAVRLMQDHVNAKAIEPHNPSSQLEFLELDCTQLRRLYWPSSVDLIVDKGTTDALLRSKEGRGRAGQVLKQCLSVLRSSGSLLQFSDEDPDARLLWLETEGREPGRMAADVGVQEVGELRGVCYYCYQVTPRPVVQ